ncbi:MAG: DMT family transporter [Rhodoferax sp.]|nr:DMT family transporter [Rhodoferax sp.]
MSHHHTTAQNERRGLWLGLLGVAIFAITLPMTRLATGTADAPQLSPWFVTLARAALAGGLSILFLLATRSRWPTAAERKPLALAAVGNALGFPLLIGFALRHISASHAAVTIALLPLATAAVAALVLHQRARLGFWISALLGASLVVAFSLFRASQHPGGLALEWADLLMVGAVLSAALGYVYGAKVTPTLGAEQVICWVCVLALPVTLPGAWLTWPTQAIQTSSWLALGYVGVFSMWAGFFAWYRGLALGGTLKVSQVQLLQPFLSILAAVPLLGESLDWVTVGFALAVVATVFTGKRLASSPAPTLAAATLATPAQPASPLTGAQA